MSNILKKTLINIDNLVYKKNGMAYPYYEILEKIEVELKKLKTCECGNINQLSVKYCPDCTVLIVW